MLASLTLPTGSELVRTTSEFTAESVPSGLLRAHRTAVGVWGQVVTLDGALTFVLETTGERRQLGPGDAQVIEPDTPHHLELGSSARFVVEFYRSPNE